jgi:hypothetical protein
VSHRIVRFEQAEGPTRPHAPDEGAELLPDAV